MSIPTLDSANALSAPVSKDIRGQAAPFAPFDAWLSYTIVSSYKDLSQHSFVLTELPGFKDVVAARTYTEVQHVILGVATSVKGEMAGLALGWDGLSISTDEPTNFVSLPHKLIDVSTDMHLGCFEHVMLLEEGVSRQISPPPTTGKIPKVFISVPGVSEKNFAYVTISYRQGGAKHTVKTGFK
jgi:hypothetical protein